MKHDVRNISKRHVCLEVGACKKEMKKSRQTHGECMLRRRRFCHIIIQSDNLSTRVDINLCTI